MGDGRGWQGGKWMDVICGMVWRGGVEGGGSEWIQPLLIQIQRWPAQIWGRDGGGEDVWRQPAEARRGANGYGAGLAKGQRDRT